MNEDCMTYEGAVPRWRQIAATVRAEIIAGELLPGDRLPGEFEFGRAKGVSRATIRQAFGALVNEGLIRVERGRGAFVADAPLLYTMGPRTRFTENVSQSGFRPGRVVLGSSVVTVGNADASALCIEEGSDVLRIETMGMADNTPISLGRNLYPLPRFTGLDDALRLTPSYTVALATFGVANYKRLSTRVTARLPSELESKRLRIPRTRPLLDTLVTEVDGAGIPIRIGRACFHADHVQFLFE